MFYIGLDLGKMRDPSAIAVVQALEVRGPYGPPTVEGFAVRYLERLPLGTPYPDVVEHVKKIVMRPELARRCLIVDGTGVGEPVMDMLRAARLGCELVSVKITNGMKENASGMRTSSPSVNVPKQDLIAGVQVLLEKRELFISRKLRYAAALAKELADVQLTQGEGGRVRIGADGYGEHDDLVMAVALAIWKGWKRKQGPRGSQGPLPGMPISPAWMHVGFPGR